MDVTKIFKILIYKEISENDSWPELQLRVGLTV